MGEREGPTFLHMAHLRLCAMARARVGSVLGPRFGPVPASVSVSCRLCKSSVRGPVSMSAPACRSRFLPSRCRFSQRWQFVSRQCPFLPSAPSPSSFAPSQLRTGAGVRPCIRRVHVMCPARCPRARMRRPRQCPYQCMSVSRIRVDLCIDPGAHVRSIRVRHHVRAPVASGLVFVSRRPHPHIRVRARTPASLSTRIRAGTRHRAAASVPVSGPVPPIRAGISMPLPR